MSHFDDTQLALVGHHKQEAAVHRRWAAFDCAIQQNLHSTALCSTRDWAFSLPLQTCVFPGHEGTAVTCHIFIDGGPSCSGTTQVVEETLRHKLRQNKYSTLE